MKLFKWTLIALEPVVMGTVVTATSCSEKTYFNYIKQIAPYAHYLEFDDYLEDKNLETLLHAPLGECTTIYKDGFYGRNFDNYYNDMPEFIVRVNAKKNRHASIGIANHYGLREGKWNAKKNKHELNLLPNHMMDGINDCGVVCNCNTVFYESNWEPWVGTLDSNYPKLHVCFMPRFVLDNASSAENAIELLSKCNIYGCKEVTGTDSNNFIMHMMVADSQNAFVVEFINNKMEVINFSQTLLPVMTNFYLKPLKDSTSFYEHSVGLERYDTACQKYNALQPNVDNFFNLLSEVTYSHFYDEHDGNPLKAWLSEHLTQSEIIIYKKYLQGIELQPTELEIAKQIQNQYEYFVSNTIPTFRDLFSKKQHEESTRFYISIHSSVYDIKSKKLIVSFQEEFNQRQEFQI